jgi:hypothetical protein
MTKGQVSNQGFILSRRLWSGATFEEENDSYDL